MYALYDSILMAHALAALPSSEATYTTVLIWLLSLCWLTHQHLSTSWLLYPVKTLKTNTTFAHNKRFLYIQTNFRPFLTIVAIIEHPHNHHTCRPSITCHTIRYYILTLFIFEISWIFHDARYCQLYMEHCGELADRWDSWSPRRRRQFECAFLLSTNSDRCKSTPIYLFSRWYDAMYRPMWAL